MRLNLGCGPILLDGHLNLDVEAVAPDGERFRRCDVRQGLPFPDGSVESINASHFLEHLTLPEARALLVECWRVLEPGGAIRVAVPDLRRLLDHYRQRRMDAFEGVQPEVYRTVEAQSLKLSLILLANMHPASTREHYLGHQLLLDEDGLAELLLEAWFGDVDRVPFDGRFEAHENHTLVMSGVRAGPRGLMDSWAGGSDTTVPLIFLGPPWPHIGPQPLFDPEVARGLALLVREGMTVLDVGCNVGWTSVYAAHLVGTSGHVFGFDGNADVLGPADELAIVNGVNDRCDFVHCLVGDAAREREPFWVATSGTQTGSSRCRGAGGDGHEVESPMVTLDGYCAESGVRPDVVKVDVGGGECCVLRGAQWLLRDEPFRPTWLIELHDEAHVRAIGGDLDELVGRLKGAHYRLWDLPEDRPLTAATVARWRTGQGRQLVAQPIERGV